jgi:preprotein translocase subunit SecF
VFQLLKNPQFEFMKRGPLLLAVSGMLVLASIVLLLVSDLNLGIEFTGGTELQLKYATTPDVGGIRSALKSAGMTAQVTTIGVPDDNEVYIRLSEGGGPVDDADLTGLVTRTLRSGVGPTERTDLNIADRATLERLLVQAPGLTATQAAELAQAVSAKRKEIAIFGSFEDLRGLPGLNAEVLGFLEQRAITGPLALRSQSYIGPAVGDELMGKARVAILLSLLMMLIYIWSGASLR